MSFYSNAYEWNEKFLLPPSVSASMLNNLWKCQLLDRSLVALRSCLLLSLHTVICPLCMVHSGMSNSVCVHQYVVSCAPILPLPCALCTYLSMLASLLAYLLSEMEHSLAWLEQATFERKKRSSDMNFKFDWLLPPLSLSCFTCRESSLSLFLPFLLSSNIVY